MKKLVLILLFFSTLLSCMNDSNPSFVAFQYQDEEQSNLIIPLYKEDQALWDKVISLDVDNLVVVINPDNGVGATKNKFYEDVILKLVLTNKTPIGYISTNYGKRNINDVKNEIDRWFQFYPQISGIFIDEVSGKSTDLKYYEELIGYIKLKGFNKDLITVLNVGSFPDFGYFNIADNIVVYEGNVSNLDIYVCDAFPNQSSIIVYGADENDMVDIIQNTHCKYVYITDDNLPNPYDTLPGYLDTELDIIINY